MVSRRRGRRSLPAARRDGVLDSRSLTRRRTRTRHAGHGVVAGVTIGSVLFGGGMFLAGCSAASSSNASSSSAASSQSLAKTACGRQPPACPRWLRSPAPPGSIRAVRVAQAPRPSSRRPAASSPGAADRAGGQREFGRRPGRSDRPGGRRLPGRSPLPPIPITRPRPPLACSLRFPVASTRHARPAGRPGCPAPSLPSGPGPAQDVTQQVADVNSQVTSDEAAMAGGSGPCCGTAAWSATLLTSRTRSTTTRSSLERPCKRSGACSPRRPATRP